MSKQYRLGVIGAGNMGMAIAQGMVRAGTPASEIILYTRSDEKRKQNAKLGFAVSDDYTKLYMQSEMVLFAVKPQTFPEMLEKLSGLDAKPLVISIAAGVPFAKMEKALSSDCPCLRLLRPAGQEEEITAADSVAQAVELLRGTTGNILAATGSKELAAYTALEDFSNRVYPRVLPTCQAIALCEELGFASSHIIAMQGPFSRGLNEALMRQYQIRYLVTKDGGGAGGFEEKLEAARQVGAQVVLVCRPDGDQGLTLDEIKEKLTRWMEGP